MIRIKEVERIAKLRARIYLRKKEREKEREEREQEKKRIRRIIYQKRLNNPRVSRSVESISIDM